MTAFGSFVMFTEMMKRLGLRSPKVDFTTPRPQRSDLADHFGGIQVFQMASDPISAELDNAAKQLSITERVTAKSKVGTGITWHNPSAPIKKKVIAFGNSFFDAGDFPHQLSWWFARWFTDFQIVWMADMIEETVKSKRPDIVICQTVERFMIRPPKS
jgi:hypothetical protein